MKKLKILLGINLCLVFNYSYSQSIYNGIGHIPVSNQVEWSKAGLLQDSPTQANNIFDVTNYGAIPNDGLNDFNAIENVLNSAQNAQGLSIIYFPAGTFNINSPINLTTSNGRDNIVFQGAGSKSTILKFTVGNGNRCFNIAGTTSSGTYSVINNINKGTNSIYVNNFSNLFDYNDWIHFYEDNFPLVAANFDNCVGQISQIIGKNGNSGTLKDKASKSYSTNYNILIQRIFPIMNVGIENLQIYRFDSGSSDNGENILFQYAVNCWIRGVEFNNTCQHHLAISRSSHIDISGCYFHEAQNYDVGGRGYGVNINFSSTNCLIQNNIFKKLRHAMLLQGGANCNVFTYNYSREQYWTNNHWPSWITGMGSDLTLHGNYPYSNLIEHNWVEKIWADNWNERVNGPYNAFVRNCVQDYDGIMHTMTLEDAPNSSVLGCELRLDETYTPIVTSGSTTLSRDLYGIVIYQNPPYNTYETGILISHPSLAQNWFYYKNYMHLHDFSYFYSTRPSFLNTSYTFPTIGPEFTTQNIPAKDRYNNYVKTYLTNPTSLAPPYITGFTQSPNPVCKNSTCLVVAEVLGEGTKTYYWNSSDLPAGSSINWVNNNCTVYIGSGIQKFLAPQPAVICTVTTQYGTNIRLHALVIDNVCSGCPTLAFEVEGELKDDNPLLITSLNNPGIDITDYYLIQNPVTPVGNRINLRIHEPQTEHTWLDYVELIEAKTKSDELVAVNDEGEIINYKKTTARVTVLLNGTTDITSILAEMDTLDITLAEGDVLTIQGNNLSSGGDEDLILGGEVPPVAKDRPSVKIRIASAKDENTESIGDGGNFSTIGELFFRPNKSIIAKKLRNVPPGNLEITINKNLVLNYLKLVSSLKTAKVTNLNLLSANHSKLGDVKALISGIDQNYAEIFPGEMIDFEFQKGNTPADKIEYILKSVGRYETDTSFSFNKTTSLAEDILVPIENKLFENYPNPFNPTTQIKYSVRENGLVTLKVYDVIGKEVAALVNEEKQAGTYDVTFNADNLASGIYFYTISVKDFHQTKKMILIK